MCKLIELSQGKTAIIDDCDYESVSRFNWHVDSKGGNTVLDYAKTWSYLGYIGGKKVKCGMRMHTLIIRPLQGMYVDHIDHNGLNNQRSNLRICTFQQNTQNRRKSPQCTSQYKGVYWDRYNKVWRSRIRVQGCLKTLYVGNNELKAAGKYNEAAISYFGEFACLNTTVPE